MNLIMTVLLSTQNICFRDNYCLIPHSYLGVCIYLLNAEFKHGNFPISVAPSVNLKEKI